MNFHEFFYDKTLINLTYLQKSDTRILWMSFCLETSKRQFLLEKLRPIFCMYASFV